MMILLGVSLGAGLPISLMWFFVIWKRTEKWNEVKIMIVSYAIGIPIACIIIVLVAIQRM